MNQLNLSKWLKIIIVGLGICGLVMYSIVFPNLGHTMAENIPLFEPYYWIWLVFIWVTGIPCYMVLFFGWKISEEIARDQVFTKRVTDWLVYISILAAVDSITFFIGTIIFFIFGLVSGLYMIISLVALFIGTCFSVVAAVLSHLSYKAVKMKEMSDLTI